MSKYKDEVDDDCKGCEYYHHSPAVLTADPYNSSPEETECDMDWECPYLESDDRCYHHRNGKCAFMSSTITGQPCLCDGRDKECDGYVSDDE